MFQDTSFRGASSNACRQAMGICLILPRLLLCVGSRIAQGDVDVMVSHGWFHWNFRVCRSSLKRTFFPHEGLCFHLLSGRPVAEEEIDKTVTMLYRR